MLAGEVRPHRVIDLHQLDRCAAHLDEGHRDAGARLVGLDDDALAGERGVEVVDLERDVGDRLDELGVGGVVPVPLPLDAVRVVLVVADGDSQVGSGISPSKRSLVGMPM
jgi:hypothetical protein